MFRFTQEPSSGSQSQCLAKITDFSQFHLNRGTGRQQCRCIVPKAIYTFKSAPEDGRICRPKHVGLN